MTDSSIAPGTVDHDAAAHDDHHPTENQYWVIFATLAVITAVEIAWSYIGLSGPALVLPLIVMMLVKFVLVAGVFMHLYFDMKFVNGKYFSWMFGFGLVLAVSVFAAVFAAFDFKV